jgi:hypothetical protein
MQKKQQKRKTKNQKISEAELEYLPKMYRVWEKLQSLMNELEAEGLKGVKPAPSEFKAFDAACGAMEDAFVRFEDAAKERGAR